MRTIRIYQPGIYQVGDCISLTQTATQHVAVVLRMNCGEKLTLFAGNNEEYLAKIIELSKKVVGVQIEAVQEVNRESGLQLHLLQAVCKLECMEWIVQKAVELGVNTITPLLTTRSVIKLDAARSEKKLAQWEAIAVSACEQCGRNKLPKLNPLLSLKNYLNQLLKEKPSKENDNTPNEIKFFMHPENNLSLKAFAELHKGKTINKISLLIGPEGGFNKEEIEQLQAHGFIGITLGPRILRTETAAVTAISLLQALWGDI